MCFHWVYYPLDRSGSKRSQTKQCLKVASSSGWPLVGNEGMTRVWTTHHNIFSIRSFISVVCCSILSLVSISFFQLFPT